MHDFSQMKFEDYAQILRRRIWWIVIPALLFVVGGFVLIRFLPRYYVANTLVLVEGQKIPSNYVESTVTSEVERRLQTIQEEVMSRSRLYEIMERFNLFPDLRDSLSTDKLIGKMRKNITIQIKHRDAFAIYYEGKDPKIVAQVANALTQQFINANLKIREEQARETANFMDEMLREQQEELKKQETELAAFLQSHPGELPEHISQNIRLIEQLSAQSLSKQEELIRAENTKIALEQQITILEEAISSNIPEKYDAKKALLEQVKALENELSLLKVSRSDLHPAIKAKKQEIKNLKAVINQLTDKGKNTKEDEEEEASSVGFEATQIDSEVEKKAIISKLQGQLDEIVTDIDRLLEDEEQLQLQLDTREGLLKRQEIAWADFLKKHPEILPEPMDRNVSIIEQLTVQIMSKQDELNHLNEKKDLLQENLNTVRLVKPGKDGWTTKSGSLPKQQKELERELALLKANYAETHPKVLEKIGEIENLKEAIKNESPSSDPASSSAEPLQNAKLRELKQALTRVIESINFIKSEQIRLKEKIQEYQEKVENAPNLEVQLKELTRKYEQERKQFEELLAKNLDAELARKLELRQKGEQFIQIDEAVPPQQPFKPDFKKVFTLSTILGIALGFGLAFLREYFDQTFNSIKDLEKSIEIPVLGSIPYDMDLSTVKKSKLFSLKKKGKSNKSPFVNLSNGESSIDDVLSSSVQEFYRVLKVKIEQQFEEQQSAKSFLVTSTAPQEGKTTTAINLAWIMTKGLNKKVVLLDCDFYRPKVGSYLGIKSKKGLTDYLSNESISLKDVLIPVSPNKFSIIPAGYASDTVEESLESHNMQDLLKDLKKDFDYVVIDTPSVMATSYESNILTPLVDGILFVVRAEQTPRDHVIHALSLLNHEKLFGAVLNCGPIAKRASYDRYTEYRIPDTASLSYNLAEKSKNDVSKPKQKLSKAHKNKNNGKFVERKEERKKKDQNSEKKKEGLAEIKKLNDKQQQIGNLQPKSTTSKNNSTDPQKRSLKKSVAESEKKVLEDISLKSKIREYLSGSNGKNFADSNNNNNKIDKEPHIQKTQKSNPNSLVGVSEDQPTVKQPRVSNRYANDIKPSEKSRQKAYIRMILDDKNGNPYADKDYMILIDGKKYTGKTSAEGLVDQEIPADAKKGELTLRPNANDKNEVVVWPLNIENSSSG